MFYNLIISVLSSFLPFFLSHILPYSMRLTVNCRLCCIALQRFRKDTVIDIYSVLCSSVLLSCFPALYVVFQEYIVAFVKFFISIYHCFISVSSFRNLVTSIIYLRKLLVAHKIIELFVSSYWCLLACLLYCLLSNSLSLIYWLKLVHVISYSFLTIFFLSLFCFFL